MVMFAEEHTEEERREVSRKVLKTWRQNSSRRAQNSDSPLLLSEERHAEEKERERERKSRIWRESHDRIPADTRKKCPRPLPR